MASKYGSQRNKQQLAHYDFETNIKKKTGKMGVRTPYETETIVLN